jgi:hypothetical protein
MKTGLIQMNTILLGVGVFVVSQYILKLILEPIARVVPSPTYPAPSFFAKPKLRTPLTT